MSFLQKTLPRELYNTACTKTETSLLILCNIQNSEIYEGGILILNYEVQKAIRCCATCVWWSGERESRPSKPNSAFIASAGAPGQCGCKDSPKFHLVGKRTQGNEKCNCNFRRDKQSAC